jgi:hypothetical protein
MADFVIKINSVIDKFDSVNTASKIPFVPVPSINIASTDVQSAVTELGNEVYVAIQANTDNVSSLTSNVNSLSTQLAAAKNDAAALAIALG